jgi:hypothetical protein
MLAFGIPQRFRGADGDMPVAGLTAASAVDAIEGASYLTVTNRTDVELFGLDGIRIDIRSGLRNAPVFGGPAGTFGLSPERDARMAVLDRGAGEFLLVLVLASDDDLEPAWDAVQEMLETVDLAP